VSSERATSAAARSFPAAVLRLTDQGQVLHERHCRENLADLLGQLGVPVDVFSQRWPLALTIPLKKLFGHGQHDLGFGSGGGHESQLLSAGGLRLLLRVL
jgi:hypothetical protein